MKEDNMKETLEVGVVGWEEVVLLVVDKVEILLEGIGLGTEYCLKEGRLEDHNR
jgi:hypothetical protein